jgi:BASS family bile acid:Na+ symporter
MILVVVLTSAGHIKSLLSVLGTFGILAALLFSLACVGIGWALGGPASDTRSVLALGTAQRNAAAALVVAGQNFDDPTVVVMITVVMIVAFIALLPVSRVFARRSGLQTAGLTTAAPR